MSETAARGLANLATTRIIELLSAVRAGRVRTPVTAMGLRLSGFTDFVPVSDTLARASGGVEVLLEAIVADRAIRRGPAIDLVWSGPSHATSDALDTSTVVRRLFANAEDHVMICGFAFFNASDIFAALYERAKQRSLQIEFFVHFSDTGAKSQDAFFRYTWPWRDIVPDVYFDPRTLDGERTMHAKSVVVDGRFAFVTSANFTTAAHSDNVEIGALTDDVQFATALVQQWSKLKAARVFVRANAV